MREDCFTGEGRVGNALAKTACLPAHELSIYRKLTYAHESTARQCGVVPATLEVPANRVSGRHRVAVAPAGAGGSSRAGSGAANLRHRSEPGPRGSSTCVSPRRGRRAGGGARRKEGYSGEGGKTSAKGAVASYAAAWPFSQSRLAVQSDYSGLSLYEWTIPGVLR